MKFIKTLVTGSSCQGEHLAAPAPRVGVSHVETFCNSQFTRNADVSRGSQIPKSSGPRSRTQAGVTRGAARSHPTESTCQPNGAAAKSTPGTDDLSSLAPADVMGLVNHIG